LKISTFFKTNIISVKLAQGTRGCLEIIPGIKLFKKKKLPRKNLLIFPKNTVPKQKTGLNMRTSSSHSSSWVLNVGTHTVRGKRAWAAAGTKR